jgi:peptidylprolyl isomerase
MHGFIQKTLEIFGRGVTMAAEQGDVVKVHYTGTLDDGSQFDSSVGGEPMEFTIGEGSLLEQFENTVVGMNPGEERTIRIAPEDGYGLKREDLVITIPKNKLAHKMHPEVGQKLQMPSHDGGMIVLNIKEITDDAVIVDANHDLAGKHLNFKIELVEII